MRLKLYHKFFISFSIVAVMIIGLMIGTLQLMVYLDFADYVNRVELDKLDSVVDAVVKSYVKYNGWEEFRRNPELLKRILEWNLPIDHNFSPSLPPPENNVPQNPSPERDFQPNRPEEDRPPPPKREDSRPPPPRDDPQRRPPPREEKAENRPSPFADTLQIGHRLSLFDKEKQAVAGHATSSEKHTFREIVLNGKTIGWLGLKITEEMYHPLEMNFIRQQMGMFYLIGCGILILALLVSYLLSRHLLFPIRQIAEGTRSLTSFQFDTRIEVHSKDELGELANAFNRMTETIKNYEAMRRQWIVDISHELRTPLSVLRGEIEAMQDGIREMNGENLASLHSEILHVNKLVDDLHLLSLADSRNLHFNIEKINPFQVLSRTLDIFRTRFRQKQIDILMEPGNTDITLSGDPDRLKQLFSNLLENTLRYADSPGTLFIRANRTLSELTIVLEDSGPGVPEESLNRLFERLYRVEKSRSRALGGSGLGLAICKEIMERHGGTIHAENAKSGGLRIILVFPL